MDALSTVIFLSAVVCVGALSYFAYEAYRTSDLERLKGILAEFVAVLAAIAIGIWISREERLLDRTAAQQERAARGLRPRRVPCLGRSGSSTA